MSANMIIVLCTIAVYLAFMIIIGFFYSKKTATSGDFYLGGRKLGPLVTAMSAEASDMSGWLLLGLPGVAMACGLAEATWTAIGLAIGTYINWLIVAKRLRIKSENLGAFTIPDYFSKSFKDESGALSGISALIIIVFFIPYTASGFNACGTLFSSLSGGKVSYTTAMIVSAIVIVAYTALGGFLAASTTDFIQSIVMTIALIVVVIFGINFAGGWDNVVSNANEIPGFLGLFETHNPATGGTSPYGALTVASTLAWGLGYFGMPHILLRFMGISNPDKLKTSRRIGTIWVIISMAVAILIGVIGSAAVANGGVAMDIPKEGATTVTQKIIIEIAKVISENGALFAIVAGIILAGILASTMSTADSQLLAASSSVSEDLFKGVFKINMTEKNSMLLARATTVLIAIIGVIWAWKEDSVFSIVSFAWAGFGAAFGPIMLCSLFWKRANKYGAIAGMIGGGAMVFLWKYVIAKVGGVFAIYELLPAFLFGLLLIVVVSLATNKYVAKEEE